MDDKTIEQFFGVSGREWTPKKWLDFVCEEKKKNLRELKMRPDFLIGEDQNNNNNNEKKKILFFSMKNRVHIVELTDVSSQIHPLHTTPLPKNSFVPL